MGNEDRPKKTWRERDAARGNRSPYSSRQSSSQGGRDPSSSHAYQEHLKAADKLFGSPAPADVAEPTAPKLAPEVKAQVQALLQETDRKAFSDAVDAYLSAHGAIPEDVYLLVRLLDHPKIRVVSKALATIERLGDAPPKPWPQTLKPRLKQLEMTAMDTDIQQRAAALSARLFG